MVYRLVGNGDTESPLQRNLYDDHHYSFVESRWERDAKMVTTSLACSSGSSTNETLVSPYSCSSSHVRIHPEMVTYISREPWHIGERLHLDIQWVR